MVTCKKCGNLTVNCETHAVGQNLHTKLEDKGLVTISPEYYQISDSGNKPVLSCICGKMDIVFTCDYCGKAVDEEPAKLIEDSNGRKLVSCEYCAEGRPKNNTITDLDVDKITLKVKS